MVCKNRLKFKRSIICSGDLNKRITLQHPVIAGSSNVDTNTTRTFTDIGQFWAAIKTRPAAQFFDDVNLSETIITDFFINYTTSIDLLKEIWVLFDNKRFKIVATENLNEDNLIIKLRANERGSSLIEATKT